MKLISFLNQGVETLGLYLNERIYSVPDAADRAGRAAATTMSELLKGEEKSMDAVREVERLIADGKVESDSYLWASVEVLAPVPHPTSCRDGYAFRQHVEAARRNRRVEMI
ncbi:MAG: fumarylacetoacetate hydrolase family protein, partial [Bacteroidota bacterium]